MLLEIERFKDIDININKELKSNMESNAINWKRSR